MLRSRLSLVALALAVALCYGAPFNDQWAQQAEVTRRTDPTSTFASEPLTLLSPLAVDYDQSDDSQPADSHMQYLRFDTSLFQQLQEHPIGTHIHFNNFLGLGIVVDLRVHQILAANAVIRVVGVDGAESDLQRPIAVHLSGVAHGDVESMVFISLRPAGSTGFIRTAELSFSIEVAPETHQHSVLLPGTGARPSDEFKSDTNISPPEMAAEIETVKNISIKMGATMDWMALYTFLIPTVLMVVLQLWAVLDSSTHPVTTTSGYLSEGILDLAVMARDMKPVWPYPRDLFNERVQIDAGFLGEWQQYRNYSEFYTSNGVSGVADIGFDKTCDTDLELAPDWTSIDAYYSYLGSALRSCTPERPLQVCSEFAAIHLSLCVVLT